MKIKFDGKELELKPLTLLDLVNLEKKGIQLERLGQGAKARDLMILYAYGLKKAYNSLGSEEEIASKLEIGSETFSKILESIFPREVTVPFQRK